MTRAERIYPSPKMGSIGWRKLPLTGRQASSADPSADGLTGPRLFSMSTVNRRRGADGELGQPRFFDRAPRGVKEYKQKVKSIHLNPVSAGWVRRPEAWSRRAGSSYNECGAMSADESVSQRTV